MAARAPWIAVLLSSLACSSNAEQGSSTQQTPRDAATNETSSVEVPVGECFPGSYCEGDTLIVRRFPGCANPPDPPIACPGCHDGKCDPSFEPPDAASEGSVDPDAALAESGDAFAGSCDTAKQNCGARETCDLVCDGTASLIECRSVPDTPIAVGSTCVSTTECGHNAGCYASVTQGGPTCRQFCGGATECPLGTTCQLRPVKRACGPADMTYMISLCIAQ